jgi:hypothetical protein
MIFAQPRSPLRAAKRSTFLSRYAVDISGAEEHSDAWSRIAKREVNQIPARRVLTRAHPTLSEPDTSRPSVTMDDDGFFALLARAIFSRAEISLRMKWLGL